MSASSSAWGAQEARTCAGCSVYSFSASAKKVSHSSMYTLPAWDALQLSTGWPGSAGAVSRLLLTSCTLARPALVLRPVRGRRRASERVESHDGSDRV